jgi:transposase
MIKADLWQEIHSRRKLRESKKSIARSLGLHIQTVRKILLQAFPKPYERANSKETRLTPYEDYILERLAAVGYCAQSIFEELGIRGYTGSYDMVKRFVSPLRAEALIEATVRFETPPRRQGQSDWGQCWTTLGGKTTKIHLFVLTLGFSRRMLSMSMK